MSRHENELLRRARSPYDGPYDVPALCELPLEAFPLGISPFYWSHYWRRDPITGSVFVAIWLPANLLG